PQHMPSTHYQLPDRRKPLLTAHPNTVRSPAFQQIQPLLCVAIFPGPVFSYYLHEFAVALRTRLKHLKVIWKCRDMMKVLPRVEAKVFTGKFAFGPRLVKRVRQQVMPGDPGIKLLAEFLSIHLCFL